jgi:hypothetical protein
VTREGRQSKGRVATQGKGGKAREVREGHGKGGKAREGVARQVKGGMAREGCQGKCGQTGKRHIYMSVYTYIYI